MVITFAHVSKKFILPHEQTEATQRSLWSRLGRKHEWRETFWALQAVSFQIARGESVGLIGANGSGKSTILKLITKILQPTSGRVQTQGRIAALLEVGAGFHPDLSGRDNIYLNGAILGLKRRELDKIFDDIVAFAELERFIDTPVKYYSSGMYARLGFAIAIHILPDILLIDEVLSVGDQAFQDKCLLKIRDIKRQGVTIVLVSHSLDSVRDLCERGIWMEGGQLREQGPVHRVIDAYLTEILRQERQAAAHTSPQNRWGSGEAEITRVEFLNGHDAPTDSFVTGQLFRARIYYHAQQRIEHPIFGAALYRQDGVQINGPNTRFSEQPVDMIEGEGMIEYIVSALPLLDGNYFFSAAIYDRQGAHPYDHHHLRYQFTVVPGGVKERYGLLYIPARWEHQRKA